MNGQTECFLCDPNEGWVFAESDHFFAMLGLGPIVPGYSLIATRDHVASMFDIPDTWVAELLAITAEVKSRLMALLHTPVILTEHGRVGLCETDEPGHEGHCYHAHQLVFPTEADISYVFDGSEINPLVMSSFEEARRRAGHLIEYLYLQKPDGSVTVGTYPDTVPRQLFRAAVADSVGMPHLRSWRETPGIAEVDDMAGRMREQG